MLRVQTIHIKSGHKLYEYFQEIGKLVNNLKNTTNYHIRQIYFGLVFNKESGNIADSINYINENIPRVNVKRINNNSTPFELIDKDNPFLSYSLINGVFSVSDNKDYFALPAHTNQAAINEVFESWKAYFATQKEYAKNPSKFTGQPRIPRYGKKNSSKTMTFSNQTCVIKDGKYLRFPKTKDTVNIGKLFKGEIVKLREVRVVPSAGIFKVEIVVDVESVAKIEIIEGRAIGIDLGVNNFAAISNNFGENTMLIKGQIPKSHNQLYNKNKNKHYGIIRKGKIYNEGIFTTKRLESVTCKRNQRILDFIHKASKNVVNHCSEYGVGTIVVGKNSSRKEKSNISKKDIPKFVQLPHSKFIDLLTYKAEEVGIKVVIQEESYTSQSSFLDNDVVPQLGESNKGTCSFSGKRVERGLYISSAGIKINADINGSLNILRKYIGDFDYKLGKILNPVIIKNLDAAMRQKVALNA